MAFVDALDQLEEVPFYSYLLRTMTYLPAVLPLRKESLGRRRNIKGVQS